MLSLQKSTLDVFVGGCVFGYYVINIIICVNMFSMFFRIFHLFNNIGMGSSSFEEKFN